MNKYVLGYKDGVNIESWAVDMFFLDKVAIDDGVITLFHTKNEPPTDIKLTLKQLKEYGFNSWLGKKPQSDYYIVRNF